MRVVGWLLAGCAMVALTVAVTLWYERGGVPGPRVRVQVPQRHGMTLEAEALEETGAAETLVEDMKRAGAEFVVLAPEVDAPVEARTLATRLRPFVEAARREGLGVTLAPRVPARVLARGHCASLLGALGKAARELGCARLAVRDANTSDWIDDAAWRRSLAAARAAFGGKLAFVATADSFPLATWWDAVDEMGVAGPFVLGTEQPTPDQLQTDWDARLTEAESVSERFARPLWLYDITGLRARRPGQKPEHPPIDVEARRLEVALETIGTHAAVTGIVAPWPIAAREAALKEVLAEQWTTKVGVPTIGRAVSRNW